MNTDVILTNTDVILMNTDVILTLPRTSCQERTEQSHTFQVPFPTLSRSKFYVTDTSAKSCSYPFFSLIIANYRKKVN